MSQMNLRIDGASCRHCVMAVHQSLQALDGVQVTMIQPCSAQLQFDSDVHAADDVLDAIRDEGFTLSAPGSRDAAAV